MVVAVPARHGPPARATSPEPAPAQWFLEVSSWLSNRIFTGYENLVDYCCEAWNKLVAQTWTIMSGGRRHWAYRY